MNRRQWKKACKKAVTVIERRWPGQFTFTPAQGDETVYSPPGYEPTRREGRIGRRYTEAPRGAPVVWERTSYEYNEWDCRDALSILHEMVAIEATDWDALAAQLDRATEEQNCRCETGCQAEQNEGRRCWRSGFTIPVGSFSGAGAA